MTTQSFNFWQDHSGTFLEMAFKTDRREALAHPDGYGKKTGDCGDTVEIFLTERKEGGLSLFYRLDGCLHTNACCNTVAYLMEGRDSEDAWNITPEQVAGYLRTLPGDHFHCAELAVGALYLALADYQQKRKQPWKRLYTTQRAR